MFHGINFVSSLIQFVCPIKVIKLKFTISNDGIQETYSYQFCGLIPSSKLANFLMVCTPPVFEEIISKAFFNPEKRN